MNKAEQRAIEKYPVEMYKEVGWRCVDKNTYKRQYFIEGYHQAEKDNELTWEDIALINNVVTEMLNECGDNVLYDTEEKFCREVLKRFKERKEK